MTSLLRILGFPSPERRDSVRFHFAKNLPYSERVRLTFVLLVIGLILQLYFMNPIYGIPFLLAGMGLALVKGYDSRVRMKGFTLDPNWKTVSIEKIQDIEPDLATTRMNDGRCDRQGRFIVGGMDESDNGEAISNVYRVDNDLGVHKIISGVACANSTCFSPDGQVMYFADTPTGEIWAYDYDTNTGAIANKRIFTDFSDQPGIPDGSIVDAEGFLWNAQWNGYRVIRYRPDGSVDRVIDIPVMNPTCVTFGGKDLDVLYVTTARYLMTPEQIEAEPLSGGLFAVKVDVKGLNEPKFCG